MTKMSALLPVAMRFHPLLLEGDRDTIFSVLHGCNEVGLMARVIRGHKARTQMGIFDEFAAAFQFPLYFGENWSAFDDCISNLDDYGGPCKGYIVVISEPDQVLADADEESLEWLVSSLSTAHAGYRDPVERGIQGGDPAVAFYVVLAGDRQALDIAEQRWVRVGAQVMTVDMATLSDGCLGL